MKKTLIAFLAGLFILATSSAALALIETNTANDGFEDLGDGSVFSYYQNSGTLLEVFDGNIQSLTELADELDILNGGADDGFYNGYDLSTLSAVSVDIYGVTDESTGATTKLGTTGTDGKIDVTTNSLSGTWATNPNTNTLSFYVVKASTVSAIYEENPAAVIGSWSTYDVYDVTDKTNAISHFVIGGSPGTPPVIPEPSTVLLLGSGLIGLALYGRKRKKE